MEEERIVYLKGKIVAREISREVFSEKDKILWVFCTCSINFCEEFPELIGKDILCKQFFLFPERYIEFFIGNPIQIIVPYHRVDSFIKEGNSDLQVYNIEIDVYEMMNEK